MLCLPGLTRNARDFHALAGALSDTSDEGPGMRVIILESRGRGRSGRADPSTYTLPQELADLGSALDAFGVESAHVVGTSRGGLLAMLVAMTAPQRLRSVVMNDIGPRIEPAGLARIGTGVGVTMQFPSLPALADKISTDLGPQFPRLEDDDWVRLAGQLASEDGDGSVMLDYDPGLAAPFRDTNAPTDPPDFWPAFEALLGKHVMVIRGAHSDILSAATVEAMRRRHPGLETFVAMGEGHAPLLWDRASLGAIEAFLSTGRAA